MRGLAINTPQYIGMPTHIHIYTLWVCYTDAQTRTRLICRFLLFNTLMMLMSSHAHTRPPLVSVVVQALWCLQTRSLHLGIVKLVRLTCVRKPVICVRRYCTHALLYTYDTASSKCFHGKIICSGTSLYRAQWETSLMRILSTVPTT